MRAATSGIGIRGWRAPLGPEGGDGGGKIVAQGTPEDIVKAKRSYTGGFSRPCWGERN